MINSNQASARLGWIVTAGCIQETSVIDSISLENFLLLRQVNRASDTIISSFYSIFLGFYALPYQIVLQPSVFHNTSL